MSKSKVADSSGSAVKKTLNDFPAFVAAEARLGELRLERGHVETRINEGLLSLSSKRNDSLDDAAQRLIDGQEGGATAVIITREELSQLVGRRRVLDRAIELQVRAVELARYNAGRAIAEASRDEYKRIVSALVRATCIAIEAAGREYEFREWFLQNDVPFASTLPPCGAPLKGLSGSRSETGPFDPESPFCKWLIECCGREYIEPSALEELGVPGATATAIRERLEASAQPGFVERVRRRASDLVGAVVGAADSWTRY